MRKRSVVFANVYVMEQVAWNLCVASMHHEIESRAIRWTPTTKPDSGMSSWSEN